MSEFAPPPSPPPSRPLPPVPFDPLPLDQMPPKPGQVTAIAILCLISGIFDCLGFFTVFMLWPFGIYSLVIGILEIIYATKILSEPIKTSQMNRTLAILQIINILNCAGLALVTGILSLVFYGDERVKAYFEAAAVRGIR